MQLRLRFAQQPTNETPPLPDVWAMLEDEQRGTALALLARLLAKAVARGEKPTEKRKERHDD